MAELKWIKITLNMFDDEKIKLIDAMPERDTIHYVWIRLLVQAGKTNANGFIYLNENIPYTDEMLSTIFNRPLNTIRLALKTLRDFGMIEIDINNFIKICNWEKHQNIEGMERVREQNRLRKQKQREREKFAQLGTERDSHMMSRDNHATEEEGEIEVEEDFTTATAYKPDSDYINFFNTNIHKITQHELQILKNYVEDGLAPEVITLALQEAVEADAKDMRYIRTVLDRWLQHGLKTIGAVEADKVKFKGKKNQQPKPQSKPSTFNNFEQRTYDFKVLEKKLLGYED
ncbi:MAG: phage replisome organizer N-terminal domain-containing protein [Bacteroidota bacterium]|nr:phage replisome organizer N-terminal domain-containing protein [Bacteroidota bacterium]